MSQDVEPPADTPDELNPDGDTVSSASAGVSSQPGLVGIAAPKIPDHEVLRQIGRGGYGEVWLARNTLGAYRAVKVISRSSFDHSRPFEREFQGIQKFEPVSRSHDGLVAILQVGRTEQWFYYVMELADDASGGTTLTSTGSVCPEATYPNDSRVSTARRAESSAMKRPSRTGPDTGL